MLPVQFSSCSGINPIFLLSCYLINVIDICVIVLILENIFIMHSIWGIERDNERHIVFLKHHLSLIQINVCQIIKSPIKSEQRWIGVVIIYNFNHFEVCKGLDSFNMYYDAWLPSHRDNIMWLTILNYIGDHCNFGFPIKSHVFLGNRLASDPKSRITSCISYSPICIVNLISFPVLFLSRCKLFTTHRSLCGYFLSWQESISS